MRYSTYTQEYMLTYPYTNCPNLLNNYCNKNNFLIKLKFVGLFLDCCKAEKFMSEKIKLEKLFYKNT